jgi:hypothetical protein
VIKYLASLFAVAPLDVPFTSIEANGNRLPFSSVIVPVTRVAFELREQIVARKEISKSDFMQKINQRNEYNRGNPASNKMFMVSGTFNRSNTTDSWHYSEDSWQ